MANRTGTVNDHRERLNRVLVHIQENIDRPLSLAPLAAVANFSPFHFHRIFSAYIGESLHEHIRRVRLEKAAQKLSLSPGPITEIALAAGYETPAAFTKAFKQFFGKNPTEFTKLKWRDPSAMRSRVPGRRRESIVKPEIRTRTPQKVLFVRKTGPYATAAAEAWSVLMPYVYSRRMISREMKAIGISHDSPDITPEEKIRYDACITMKDPAKPEGEVGVQTIAGGRYAVFLHKGPYKNFNKTYDYIMARWYPESGEKFRDLPCFEVYLNRDPRRTKPGNLRTEIYVPIE
jgi:AraC family transcriptional regulator